MLSIDTSELDAWTAVVAAARAEIRPAAELVVAKGALNIKNDARRLAPAGPHLPHYASSISYDLTSGLDWIQAEVGPVEGRAQRGLGNLLEYGSVNNRPHPHHEPAADAEEPRLWAAASALAADLVERRR